MKSEGESCNCKLAHWDLLLLLQAAQLLGGSFGGNSSEKGDLSSFACMSRRRRCNQKKRIKKELTDVCVVE